MKIAFFYNNFYPVVGGESVHAYYLTKELSKLGIEINTFGTKTEYVNFYKKSVFNLIKIIIISDVVYLRLPLIVKPKHRIILFLAKFFKKKIIGELNGPVDELFTQGYTKNQINKIENNLSSYLMKLTKIVVVSPKLKYYVEKYLHNTSIIIENGGDVIMDCNYQDKGQTLDFFKKLKKKYTNIIIWSGTFQKWQGFDIINELIMRCSSNNAFILVSNSSEIKKKFKNKDNCFIINNMEREKLRHYIKLSDIGLVLYGDFSWSKVGYYGRPLKFYEYLCNLYIVTNKNYGITLTEGFYSKKISEIIHFINNVDNLRVNHTNCRTWKDVAIETKNVIENL